MNEIYLVRFHGGSKKYDIIFALTEQDAIAEAQRMSLSEDKERYHAFNLFSVETKRVFHSQTKLV